eukprot:TRINITY_DN14467_c0_g1_i1.p1 TRINITY_DN14467_c0_g1~~TRINITY_DN14467_c0_g1_i1.p1  ORF type:complete len:983 (-),score=183.02 TRINITY_DN14467_c0_g1_i1:298-3246(-)
MTSAKLSQMTRKVSVSETLQYMKLENRVSDRRKSAGAPMSRVLTTGSDGNQVESTYSVQPSKKGRHSRRWGALVTRRARWLCESKEFAALTALFTAYALVGDDIRLMCTRKPADSAFDVFTIIAMAVFFLDIVLNAIGKDDYLLSFLFILDMVSTSTMLLDLTWVAESMQSDEEDLDHLRGSRTARMGAKAGRVVRVIRLVRILKLYKTIYEARSNRPAEEHKDEDDDWGDADLEKSTGHHGDESKGQTLVGKQLTHLTIRRVICLVLLMMLVLPLLTPDLTQRLPLSATYGADRVMQTYAKMVNESNIPGVSSVLLDYSGERDRRSYEKALLRYLYYHNWFTAKLGYCPHRDSSCSQDFWTHVFWVGISAKSEKLMKELAEEAQVRKATMEQWTDRLYFEDTLYTYGRMPPPVEELIARPWRQLCESGTGRKRLGLSLLELPVTSKDPPHVAVKYPVACPEDLRKVETVVYQPLLTDYSADWRFVFYFDARSLSVADSSYAILVTAFVCCSLCAAAMFFTDDANKLVLNPVESMINKVEIIRNNPLSAITIADEDFRVAEARKAIEQKQEKQLRRQRRRLWGRIKAFVQKWLFCKRTAEVEEPMETVILEKTIIKLGSLLALGFGEAGAQIIGENIGGVDSAMVDPLVPGRPVDCIMGIICISDFETVTEVLQGKVVAFVNQVAEIVHGVVDEFHGAVNRNDGDTFLTIWRHSEEADILHIRRQADMSMITMARIIALASRSPVLATYREHPGLQNKIDNYRVNLTCCLHAGWAIEGAVGSEFKIDASYMSPNVSTAETVSQLTRIYGVPVLVSHSVLDMCTHGMAAKCRLIDRVKLCHWTFFLELFTIDLDHMSLTVEVQGPQPVWNTRQRFRARQLLDSEKTARLNEQVSMASYFQTNPDIAAMRFRYTLEFIHIFDNGLQNYLEGEWGVAERLLRRTSTLLGVEDGPSLALLRYMARFNYCTSDSWCGVREISRDELV